MINKEGDYIEGTPKCCTTVNKAIPALLILQPFCHFTYITIHSPTLLSLYLHHSSFSYPSIASPTSQYILQPFFCLSYITSSLLNSPGEQQSSLSNLSVTSPTSQLILQPFHRYTFITAHSPTLPLLHLHHSSFSNPSFVSPTSQVLLASSRVHSPTFLSLHLRHNSCFNLHHSSFCNPSIASPKSQFILQPFFRFSYVTSSSLNSPGEPPMNTRRIHNGGPP